MRHASRGSHTSGILNDCKSAWQVTSCCFYWVDQTAAAEYIYNPHQSKIIYAPRSDVRMSLIIGHDGYHRTGNFTNIHPTASCEKKPRLLDTLEKCQWKNGGYIMRPVWLNASTWINMHRARTDCTPVSFCFWVVQWCLVRSFRFRSAPAVTLMGPNSLLKEFEIILV